MGYYSNFNGCYCPKNKLTDEQSDAIVDWFVKRFGDYNIINSSQYEGRIESPTVNGVTKWYAGDIYYDPDDETVYPVETEMKGYDFNEQLYEFVEFVKSIGIEYTGDVERDGEESDDFEKVSIENGQVISRASHIVWGDPIVVSETEAQKNARYNEMFKSTIAK